MNSQLLLKNYTQGNLPDIGNDAIWSVSSCKREFPISNLRDNNIDTYWQSDGNQPHTITCQFRSRQQVVGILLYADSKSDESYTPSHITIKAGNDFNDLVNVVTDFKTNEPKGWIPISIKNSFGNPLRTWMLQIVVTQNIQSGRDSHLRMIAVLGPGETEDSKFKRLSRNFNMLR